MERAVTLLSVVLLAQGLASIAQSATWKVDTAHTTVGFSVVHLFSNVQGRFDRFNGTIEFDPAAPEKAVVKASIEAASINTNNEKRDKHLRSDDFFGVEKYPTLSFESTGSSDWSGDQGTIEGNLTIHGVTKPVALDVKFRGQGKDPWGNVRAGFEATLTIDRKDYGLNWNELLETGGVLVGDEVTIRLDVEGILAK